MKICTFQYAALRRIAAGVAVAGLTFAALGQKPFTGPYSSKLWPDPEPMLRAIERFDALGEFAQEEQFLRSLISPKLTNAGAVPHLALLYMAERKTAEAQDLYRRFPAYQYGNVLELSRVIQGGGARAEVLALASTIVPAPEVYRGYNTGNGPYDELQKMVADPTKWRDIAWLCERCGERASLLPLLRVLKDAPSFAWAWSGAGFLADASAFSLQHLDAYRVVNGKKVDAPIPMRDEQERAKMLELAISYYKKAVQTATDDPVLAHFCKQCIVVDKVELAWTKARISGQVKPVGGDVGYNVNPEMSARADALPAQDFKQIGQESVVTLQFPRDEAALNRPLKAVFDWSGQEADGAISFHATATLRLMDSGGVRSVSAGVGLGRLTVNKDGSLTDRETRWLSKLGYPRVVLTFHPSLVLARPRPIVGKLTIVIQ